MSIRVAHESDSDEVLVERVRSGDTASFDELFRRHEIPARRLARWITHDTHVADDVVADVFASILAALRSGRGPHDDFGAYLRTSIRNRCIAQRRAADAVHTRSTTRSWPTASEEAGPAMTRRRPTSSPPRSPPSPPVGSARCGSPRWRAGRAPTSPTSSASRPTPSPRSATGPDEPSPRPICTSTRRWPAPTPAVPSPASCRATSADRRAGATCARSTPTSRPAPPAGAPSPR